MSFASAKIMTDPISIQIAIISYEFQIKAVKLVKIFLFKSLKIDSNTSAETVVFDICGYIFIEFVNFIFVKSVIVSHLNVYAIIKEDF